MKIAAFDTLNHPTPILREFGIGFEDLGYEFHFYGLESYSLSSASENEYDYIFYVSSLNYSEVETFKKSNPNTKIIYATDFWRDELHKYKNLFHSLLTTQTRCPEFSYLCDSEEMRLLHCPLAGNDRIFFPIEKEKDIDISFVGTLAHGDRGESRYLYPLIDCGKYNFYLAGMTYKDWGVPFLPYSEVNEIRNRSKININFHTNYQKEGKGQPLGRVDLNQSVYNIALAGGFQICDHPEAKLIFGGSIIVPDDKDWVNCVEYYMNHEEERNECAKKALEIARKHHTWKERMKNLCSKL